MEEGSKSRSGHSSNPDHPVSTSEKHPAPSNNDAANKRRRGLGVVTPNACTECRKKRAKVCSVCPFPLSCAAPGPP